MSNQLTISAEHKIHPEHRSRLAIVYVRQSTVHQVQHHQESTQLQYGLVEHARRLGWPQEQVLVIDEDLGISGASAEGRLGFQRLLSEVYAFQHPQVAFRLSGRTRGALQGACGAKRRGAVHRVQPRNWAA